MSSVDSGTEDIVRPERTDVVSTDCETLAQVFECEAARCVAELALTGKVATAKADQPGRRTLVLAHESFRLNRRHDPEEPLDARLKRRAVRQLLRNRDRAPVTSTFTYTEKNGKRRNIKAPYILTDD